MLFIRPVRASDLPALLAMSKAAGVGMTSMPNDEKTWQHRINSSETTFRNQGDSERDGAYFMVAEDSDTGQVVGTTAIYIGIGTRVPFFSYRQTLLVKYSAELDKMIENNVLNLVNDFTRASEIGSLFLSSGYRRSDYGQFMSRSRYLFMADFPDRIAEDVIAEMRGWQNSENQSPFWQALGKKFFDLPFENADYLTATKGTLFIQDLMPKYPVYLELLPADARACIGKPHDLSAKAIHLLKKEGFRYCGYVDVFDGGPTVQCQRQHIQSVRDARDYQVVVDNATELFKNSVGQRYLISNKNINAYRIIIHSARVSAGRIAIPQRAIDILQISAGDRVNVLAMREKHHG